MVVSNEPIEYIIEIIKIASVAVLGFIGLKVFFRWLDGDTVTKTQAICKSVELGLPVVSILIFLVLLFIILISWLCGYLYCKKQYANCVESEE